MATIVGLGELVWDLFPAEAPRLGGAPANVAYHLTLLGERGVLASRVGQDARGDQALALLQARGVAIDAVQRDATHPTGTVRVSFDRGGEPSFAIDAEGAWSHAQWTPAWQALVASAEALCFGSLLQAFAAGRALLEALVVALPPAALRLLDLNLRPPFDTPEAIEAALAAANTVKLNEAEARIVGAQYGVTDVPRWLLEERGMRAVAITRGKSGSLLTTTTARHDHPGVVLGPAAPASKAGRGALRDCRQHDPKRGSAEQRAGDPVGAGDAFSAVLLHHLLAGSEAVRANTAANHYAAHVAAMPGAMPAMPPELLQAVRAPALRADPAR